MNRRGNISFLTLGFLGGPTWSDPIEAATEKWYHLRKRAFILLAALSSRAGYWGTTDSFFCFMFVSKFRQQEFTSFSTSLRRKWFTVCRPCFFRREQNAQWCVLGSWIEWEVDDWNCKLSKDGLQIKLLESKVSGRFSHHLLHQSPGWLQPFSLTGLEIGCRSPDMCPWVFSCCWVPSACSFWFPFQTCNSAEKRGWASNVSIVWLRQWMKTGWFTSGFCGILVRFPRNIGALCGSCVAGLRTTI